MSEGEREGESKGGEGGEKRDRNTLISFPLHIRTPVPSD